jgi:hypothetical protein
MRLAFRTLGVTALALAFIARAGWGQTDGPKTPQSPDELVKALAEAGKTGPEHAKLQPLVGNWTYTAKFWMDPSKPPLEAKGTIERKLVLGGRFLEERVEGTNFDGKPGFEGRGLVGYDNGQQKYTSTWACSNGTGICSGLGAYDTSDTKFTFQTESFCPLRKKIVKGREVIRLDGDEKTVAESYLIEDGKETKVMEIVATRTK